MRSPLHHFHPLVRRWFTETLGAPSEPQRRGWPAIASGDDTLVLAPTGTGKTLAAFLWELNQLITEGLQGPLPNAVRILYVSPLKALNNDIYRNLERPLAELRARFEQAGKDFPEIRVAVRTGDTPSSARARMLRRAPHVLITTPESLHIMLTSERGRGMFSLVRAVIVDEIHAMAGSKRGVHLALSLERLDARCETRPQRIGLSATQRPLEEIGRFLVGIRDWGLESGDSTAHAQPPRPESPVPSPQIIDCGLVKPMDLSVVSPVEDLGNVGGSVWPKVAELALQHIRTARTTLIFVNNRAQAEKIAARVNALAGEELARPYHGSLARERRYELERALKAGELPALVATSSLELGIDIGSVDLVLQLQSPKRVAAGLQRVGRAGHTLAAVSRGVFVPTFRDDLVETAALVAAMRDGDVEPTRVPQNALDVLAQVIVAMVSVDDWDVDELYALVRRAYPYHRLTKAAFDEVLAMLSGKYPADLAAELEPRITWDRVSGRLSGSRASRMLAVISGGTIPDRGLYTVHLADRTRLGELDEEFVHESRHGDVFQLGSATWRIAAIEHDRVIVTPAPGAPARMPFWHGEYSARSAGLAGRIGEVRRLAGAAPSNGDVGRAGAMDRELAGRYSCDEASARSLREYIAEQRASTGIIPDEHTIVVEHFRDELGAVRIVIHSVFGGRVNAPWGMALAQRVRAELGGVDVQVQTSDDGIMLRLPDLGGSPPLHALAALSAEEAQQRVLEEVGTTPLFGARFRMNAARALLLPRQNPRRRMPLWLQRLKALDLLEVVRQFPTFPILVETYREVMQDAFDLAGMQQVLRDIAAGRIAVRTVETVQPSPFAGGLQFGFVMDWLYADDTPRAEQRATWLSVDRALLDDVMGALEGDDETAKALADVLAERRGTAPGRRARSADELAHLLDRAGDLTIDELRERVAESSEWKHGDPVEELLASGRAIAVRFGATEGPLSRWRLILTESYPRYASALGTDAVARVRAGPELAERSASDVVPDVLRVAALEQSAARREILARYLMLAGPVTVSSVAARYGWDARWIEARFEEWQRASRLVRSRFGERVPQAQWCASRVLDMARKRALAALRREIEAVDVAAYAGFLQRWQHLDPRDRMDGVPGLEAVLKQLHGVARPAAAWERDYLPARLNRYDPLWLPQLGASGKIVWAGGGRPDAVSGTVALSTVRFFPRGEGALWIPETDLADELGRLSSAATSVHEVLSQGGASFAEDLQHATGLGLFALRDALRELVAAGLVTNDSVEALREVIRMRPLPNRPRRDAPDPARWLPADFTPTPGRPVVQRRPNIRRLPRWRRSEAEHPSSGWEGRWSLVRAPGTWGEAPAEEEHAEAIARQWLERYGVVTRDWWRRERPAVSWRAIYRELRRLEFRGEVRRGYFVRGLAGAQFALPDAVERLRAARDADEQAPFVVMAMSDPANPYALSLEGVELDALARPRGAGALLVTRAGRIAMAVEGRGRRLALSAALSEIDITEAARVLADHLKARPHPGGKHRPPVIESIDGLPAFTSPHVDAFARAGWRRGTDGLVYWGVGIRD
ncbi:MAG TPA: DEAD/DEAH box helicase [Gemmatimonadaceae bacterium]|nr:DEAD/DEAH box helicase [Gemmatimonadaceae bacterium]